MDLSIDSWKATTHTSKDPNSASHTKFPSCFENNVWYQKVREGKILKCPSIFIPWWHPIEFQFQGAILKTNIEHLPALGDPFQTFTPTCQYFYTDIYISVIFVTCRNSASPAFQKLSSKYIPPPVHSWLSIGISKSPDLSVEAFHVLIHFLQALLWVVVCPMRCNKQRQRLKANQDCQKRFWTNLSYFILS